MQRYVVVVRHGTVPQVEVFDQVAEDALLTCEGPSQYLTAALLVRSLNTEG